MPLTTPDIKVDAVRRLGGEVELIGESYSETQAHAQVSFLPAWYSLHSSSKINKNSCRVLIPHAWGWERKAP